MLVEEDVDEETQYKAYKKKVGNNAYSQSDTFQCFHLVSSLHFWYIIPGTIELSRGNYLHLWNRTRDPVSI